ncbi:MAG: hypothetical protein OHK0057_31930 [Thermoflexibacter sp.]
MKSKGKLKFIGLFLGLLITLANFATVQSDGSGIIRRYKPEVCITANGQGVHGAKCATPSPSGSCDTETQCAVVPIV